MIAALIWATGITTWLWFMVCCFRTSWQRRKLIRAAFSDFQRDREWSAATRTDMSFNRHLWRLLTMRNPWAIYPPALVEATKRGAGPWFESAEGIAAYEQWFAAKQLQDSSVRGLTKQ